MANLIPLGEPFDRHRTNIFSLDLKQHLTAVNPVKYGLKIGFIDPINYFTSSGDAVEKTKALLNDIDEQFEDLAPIKEARDYLAALQVFRSEASVMLTKLLDARGSAFFLEVEWEDHILRCIPKNPRIK